MSGESAVVRPPRQRRSRESYERVMAATGSLLAETGFEGVTIQEVATWSEVSVGAIYERFGNKETLLRSVHARFMQEMADDEAAAWARMQAVDARSAVAAAVAVVAGAFQAHQSLLRVFMHLGAVDEVIAARGSQNSIALSRRFTETLLVHRAQLAHRDAELAVDVAFRMTYSTCARRVMYGTGFESERPLSWEEMARELIRACTAYLFMDPTEERR